MYFLLHFDSLSSSPTRLDSEPSIRIITNPLYVDEDVIMDDPEAETTFADDSHPKLCINNNDIAPEKPDNALWFEFGDYKPE